VGIRIELPEDQKDPKENGQTNQDENKGKKGNVTGASHKKRRALALDQIDPLICASAPIFAGIGVAGIGLQMAKASFEACSFAVAPLASLVADPLVFTGEKGAIKLLDLASGSPVFCSVAITGEGVGSLIRADPTILAGVGFAVIDICLAEKPFKPGSRAIAGEGVDPLVSADPSILAGIGFTVVHIALASGAFKTSSRAITGEGVTSEISANTFILAGIGITVIRVSLAEGSFKACS